MSMQLIGKCERHLNVPLTEKEKADESLRLMVQLDDFDKLENDAKSSATYFKDSMKNAWDDINQTRKIIKDGPVKLVKCHQFLDHVAGSVITVRNDTGEEVGSRKAEDEDYQTKMEIITSEEGQKKAV